jgi:PRTRC genetic system ThiF family protein
MHMLDPELLRRPVRVLVIGCGGSGSSIASGLPYLHQAMIVAGHAGGLHVTIMDGDVISPANCIRQPFCSSEIGLAKAIVMVSRLNLFWGLHWTAMAENLTAKTDISNFDIVIGCVDTRAARQLIHERVAGWRSRVAYWLDLGNSADSGQFVLGQPLNGRNRRSRHRLRTARELFPEIVVHSLDGDETPSCSALEALERQEPFVNQVLAYHALALLTQLFRYGRIGHHGAFVNVHESRVQPIWISSALWQRLRRRGRRLVTENSGGSASGKKSRQ